MANHARVLLVAPDEPQAHEAARGLKARGIAVSLCHEAPEAIRAGRDGVDIAVVAVPQSLDTAALCTNLKEDVCAPSLLLIGDSAAAEALAESLPGPAQPDAILPGPPDSTKLLFEIHELLREQQLDDDEALLPLSFAELLVALHDRDDAGVLEVRKEGVTTAIHLARGRPVFAEGGSLQETLGRLLVQHGAMSEEDYVRVVARMTEGVIRQESLRMGEVLVEMGLLSPAEVSDALALQVREKIVACFQWERFDFELQMPDGDDRDWSVFQCPPLEALILFGVRAHYSPDRVAPVLDAFGDEHPVLLHSPSEVGIRHQMTAGEQRLLRIIDGNRSLTEIESLSGLDRHHARQLLTTLALSRSLDFRACRASAGERTAIRPKAKPARDRKRAAPPRPTRPAPAAPDPTEQAARLQAEVAFNQGIALLREQQPEDAHVAFERASSLLQDEPEYQMLEAWAAYLKLRSNLKSATRAAAAAHRAAQQMLEVSSRSARAHRILSWLARDGGEIESAESHSGMALRLDVSVTDKSLGMSGVFGKKKS